MSWKSEDVTKEFEKLQKTLNRLSEISIILKELNMEDVSYTLQEIVNKFEK